jgi:ABC-type polysaccharide/polyol phosphate export permease
MQDIALLEEFRAALKYREVVYNFIYTTLTVKYKRSFLGYLWTILAPMMRYLVLCLVFYHVGKMTRSDYFVHMFSGSILFTLMTVTFVSGAQVFIVNEHFIKRIYVPKIIYVLNIVGYEFVNFFLLFIALLILGVAFSQVHFSVAWIFLPVALFIVILANVGLVIIGGMITLNFRDFPHIADILLNCLYFLTPILTFPEQLPVQIVRYNPLYYYVELFRRPIARGEFPPWTYVLFCTCCSIAILLLGMYLLKRFANRIVYKL